MKRLRNGRLAVILLLFLLILPAKASALQTSGICGPNLFWTFDVASGTLTVIGEGGMNYSSRPPWTHLQYQTTKVVIQEGVTSVGLNAFNDFRNLQTVILPSTVTSLGSYAFYNCDSLQLPSLEHITRIGDNTFSGCGSLTELTIPAGVRKIGSSTFSCCANLRSVTFPNGLTSIGSYAFTECKALTSVVIPDSVTEICDSAFRGCRSLTSVTLSSNLTDMRNGAFSDCTQLKKIVIPDRLTELNQYVFSGCTALEEVVLGASLCKIGCFSFRDCTALQTFTLSNENACFRVDRGVLYERDTNTLYLMPPGFRGSYDVLPGTAVIGVDSCYDVKGLTGITLPDSVTLLDDDAFFGCSGLAAVRLSNNLETIGEDALHDTAIQEILIPKSVTYIQGYAFAGCTQLKKIVFAGEPPRCGNAVFENCVGTAYYTGEPEAWKPLMGLSGDRLEWVPLSNAQHSPVTDPGKAPTCTQTGLTEGSHCSICLTVLIPQETVPVTEHSYSQWVSLDGDTHKSTCSQCGSAQTSAHSWDLGTVVTPASCMARGQVRYTCADCKHSKTEDIPLTEHSYTDTCDPQCNVCGEKREIAHSYSEVYSWDNKSHWYTCWICGEQKDAGDHIPGEDNTCLVCGHLLADTQSGPSCAPAIDFAEQTPPDHTTLWWGVATALAGVSAVTLFFLKRKKL